MSPRRRRALLIALVVLAVALIVAPVALASAGGGSANFGGGGDGGGGGGGKGFALYIIIDLLIHIAVLGHGLGALVLIALALAWWIFTRGAPKLTEWWAARAAQRRPHATKAKTSKRERRVELAAAEAAEDDPEYAPDKVRESARLLFTAVQDAWDQRDSDRMRTMVGPDLYQEWLRRLEDFNRRGWHNRVQLIGEPTIE